MKYEELLILLPCHSLEDFPLHPTGADAESLLACWSALWHPAFIATAGKMPSWKRADDPPASLANKLLTAPLVSETQLPTGLAARAKQEGGTLVRKLVARRDVLDAALAGHDTGDAGIPADLAEDFLALGYCYLQVQLLTRHMRYTSSLDEIHFQNTVVAAAQCAAAGDATGTKEKLQAAFDVLAEERARYYPVDVFLVDITLVAPTTFGPSFVGELEAASPTNVLLSGDTLSRLAAAEPETLSLLKRALESERVGLIGGEFSEGRLPLQSVESLLAELQRGLTAYAEQLGKRPTVYGRRRFGFSPHLPQLLTRLGFVGAVHASFDGGVFPHASQSKVQWQGLGGSEIPSLAKAPRDANDAATFLGFATKLGESMDSDHVATQLLAHWPAQTSPWHGDLRRIARYGTALGKFVTVEAYFRETAAGSHGELFTPDQYGSEYLRDALIRQHPEIIGAPLGYWKRQAAASAGRAWHNAAAAVRGKIAGPNTATFDEANRWHDEAAGTAAAELTERTLQATQNAAYEFAGALPRAAGDAQRGYLVVNPHSSVRRVGVELPDLAHLPPAGRPIYAVGESFGRKHAVVDVPPLGFVWISPGKSPPVQAKLPEPLAEEGVLRNEYFEVLVQRETGALRSIHNYGKRGNRLSQQLALRLPGKSSGDDANLYSVMAADEINITANDHALGEITCAGRLLDREGRTLAGYRTVYQLWRGSRVLLLNIELDPQTELKADPWNSYFCSRFAWNDEAANLYRTAGETRQPANARKLEAPLYFEIEGAQERTCIFTGGLPFHRRVGARMLDSLLMVKGDTRRSFQLGIGLDVAHPLQEALALLQPPLALPQVSTPPTPQAAGWLFHVDAKNVIATHWSPEVAAAVVTGVRVRLQETSGRPAHGRLAALRSITRGEKLNFAGQALETCPITEGKLEFKLAAGEFAEFVAYW